MGGGGEGELLSGGEADAKNNSVNARGGECVCVHSKGNCTGSWAPDGEVRFGN